MKKGPPMAAPLSSLGVSRWEKALSGTRNDIRDFLPGYISHAIPGDEIH